MHVVNHHHHFSGWDKYDGEWVDSVQWHPADHPHHQGHTQTYKGMTEHTTGACLLGTACEKYAPVLEDPVGHLLGADCECDPIVHPLGWVEHRPMARV